MPKWGYYLREQWRKCFASHLSTEVQNAIGIGIFHFIN
ncbi:hypothetical protein FG383_03350 [Psychrobacillus soli]|uniref:Uncharacterized protein n=1 Tax=Psychrobacillus soli TaxID=1543965 RepID=A0A544TKM8_9BACI|nr:hypothetical protein FG383_03350 [Psychrobacillus soli]